MSRLGRTSPRVGHDKPATGVESKSFDLTLNENGPPKRAKNQKQHDEVEATTTLTPAVTRYPFNKLAYFKSLFGDRIG